MEGSDHCIWHADSDEVSKSPEALQQACAPPDIREQTSDVAELLDGAKLSGLQLGDAVTFGRVMLRDSNISETNLEEADLTEANLRNADVSDATLVGADLTEATLWEADLTNTNLRDTTLSNAILWSGILTNTYFKNADLSNAILSETDFTDAKLRGANLRDTNVKDATLINTELREVDLTNSVLSNADLTNASLRHANLTEANLWKSNLTEANLWDSNLTAATLVEADLTDAELLRANLTDANLSDSTLINANLRKTDLTDTNLSAADLTNADLEHAVLVRANLFDANLTNCRPHGATFTDVQINDGTEFRAEEQRISEANWWQTSPIFPPQRCGYDPAIIDTASEKATNQLGKAADTYQTFEKLARENARPSLQSEMFVLRQDMQRKRHWRNGEYLEWGFARLSRAVFKYGESLSRIVTCAVAIIATYAVIYSQFDLIRDASNRFVANPVDALYFSTLTFTTLGLGDFQPEPTSQIARLLVTSQAALGAILIAVFVFVLGRRAAR
ncbi:pentapeptide repeat-containing protein [Natronomonas sp. CBA1123]|uniref:pentapeptide repeat-containing protein n=1 Tax=Natronomonas sp. CBA1123 TaxID=2668070 RepID=UPI0018D249DF